MILAVMVLRRTVLPTWERLREVHALGREGQVKGGAEDAMRMRAEDVVSGWVQLCCFDKPRRVKGRCIPPHWQPISINYQHSAGRPAS